MNEIFSREDLEDFLEQYGEDYNFEVSDLLKFIEDKKEKERKEKEAKEKEDAFIEDNKFKCIINCHFANEEECYKFLRLLHSHGYFNGYILDIDGKARICNQLYEPPLKALFEEFFNEYTFVEKPSRRAILLNILALSK